MKKIQILTKRKQILQIVPDFTLLALTALFLGALFLIRGQPTAELNPGQAVPPARVQNDAEVSEESEPEVIDLNRAWSADLESLPGIGPVLAGRILEYRRQHGGFQTPEELLEVPGMGQATYDTVRDRIMVGGGDP